MLSLLWLQTQKTIRLGFLISCYAFLNQCSSLKFYYVVCLTRFKILAELLDRSTSSGLSLSLFQVLYDTYGKHKKTHMHSLLNN